MRTWRKSWELTVHSSVLATPFSQPCGGIVNASCLFSCLPFCWSHFSLGSPIYLPFLVGGQHEHRSPHSLIKSCVIFQTRLLFLPVSAFWRLDLSNFSTCSKELSVPNLKIKSLFFLALAPIRAPSQLSSASADVVTRKRYSCIRMRTKKKKKKKSPWNWTADCNR